MKFNGLRGWIDALKQAGELHEIDAEVDWDRELGTVTRKAFGNGDGPALLFRNIKGYQDGRCTKLFTGGLSNYTRVAKMFGLPSDASVKDIVLASRDAIASRIPPVEVETGPVKENIVKGDDIDLFEFPVPRWHRKDGGRYINTFQGTVTKDPETGIFNVGIYRGMIGQKNTIPVLIWRAQHWGLHATEYEKRHIEMPVAFVSGWAPSPGFAPAT